MTRSTGFKTVIRTSVAAALAAAVVALAGCTGAASTSSAAAGAAGSVGMAVPEDAAHAAPSAAVAAASAPASAAPAPGEPEVAYDAAASSASGASVASLGAAVTNRQIIRTADVALTVTPKPDEPDGKTSAQALADAAARAAAQVRALANLPGGYVSATDGHGATISVTLRIPAGSYDSVMGRIEALGTVTSESESTSDVTGEMIDVASRVASAKASVDRLRALMAEATSLKDVIALESELTTRESDLESLQRRSAELSDEVALSTITISVSAIPKTMKAAATKPAPKHSAFVAGLLAGWHGIGAVGRVVAAIAGALLPFLPLIVVLGAAGWFGVRRARRQRAARSAVAVRPTEV